MAELGRRASDQPSFLCAPGLRIEAQERYTELQFAQVSAALAKIEAAMDRLERRLWVTVYGVTGVVLVEVVRSFLNLAP
jgi:hypothetical protein